MPPTDATPPKKFIYKPYKLQMEFHACAARFRIVCAGRRSGKTYSTIQEVFKLCAEKPNQRVWWVSLTLEVAERGLETFQAIFPEGSKEYERYVRKIKLAPPKSIFFKNGSRIDFKSADHPRSLVGAGLDFLVIDEAAFIPDDVWYRYLRPTLTDKGGRAIIISTPDRKNFFHALYQKGKDPDRPEYESFHWNTLDNIYIKNVEKEVEQAREDLSEEEFRNLFLAEFLEDDSAVFRGIPDCIREQDKVQSAPGRWWVENKNDGKHVYAFGVDVAKSGKDFTVIIVTKYIRNSTKWEKRVVYLERINENSLLIQAQRITELWSQFGKPTIHIDATSIGGALVDELGRYPQQIPTHSLKPIVFDGKNKGEIIGRLRADIEHNRVSFPRIPVLLDELLKYQREYNPRTGHVKYAAPGRGHDDTVVALALATMRESVPTQRVFGRETRTALGF